MADKNILIIDLKLGKDEISAAINKTTASMMGLQSVISNIETGIIRAFGQETSMHAMKESIDSLANSVSCVVVELQNLISLLTVQHEETQLTDWYATQVDILVLIVEMYTLYQTLLSIIGTVTAAQIAQASAISVLSGVELVSTGITTAFGAAIKFLTDPIGLVILAIAAVIAIVALLIANWDTVKETALSVWEKIKETLATVAQWVHENVLQPMSDFFSSAMEWIGTKVQEGVALVQSILGSINTFLQGVFAKDWTEQFGAFGNVLNAFFANVQNIWNAVKSIFSGIVSFVKNIFAGNWSAAWDSIVNIFKGIWDCMLAVVKAPINGIIGLINGLVEGVVGGINLVINALNGMSFDIPDWIPVIGGETFGFNLAPLTAPKIPLLAKGAVLPANRPFLAVVGDQRHGTNVEAPLSTIQEAVAVVLNDQLSALMAGFEAVVAEQRATREMIAGIRIGDDTLANAVHRYDRKMAVMRGGVW